MNSLKAAAIALLLTHAAAVEAQNSEPDRIGPPADQAGAGRGARAFWLERGFFVAKEESWTFFHDVDTLPADMRLVLNRAAGADVVGPGEAIDESDIINYVGRVQHLYTAVTNELGVIVWYTTGPAIEARAVLYDRELHDACRYNFGRQNHPVVPLGSVLRSWIQTRGLQAGGCEYLGSEVF